MKLGTAFESILETIVADNNPHTDGYAFAMLGGFLALAKDVKGDQEAINTIEDFIVNNLGED